MKMRWLHKKTGILAVIMLLLLVPCSVLPTRADIVRDKLTERFMDNVIQLTVNCSNGDRRYGFGFVVGEQKDKLYVVTANHVVRPEDLDGNVLEVKSVLAQFHKRRGKFYSASVLNLSYPRLDIALVEISKPFGNYTWERGYFYPRPKRNDEVWFIGRNRDWYIPTAKATGLINKEPIAGELHVDMYSVQLGTSGAPLLTEKGIVGMIIEDDSDDVVALDIETIRKIVVQVWNYPWNLQNFYDSTTTTLLESPETTTTTAVTIPEEPAIPVDSTITTTILHENTTTTLPIVENRDELNITQETELENDFDSSEPSTDTTDTALAKFLSQLEAGNYLVIVASWETEASAQKEVEEIKAKYPELFSPQLDSDLQSRYYDKYGEGKYFDGKYWAIYIGGFYTYENAYLLREKAVKELGMKDAYVRSPIAEEPGDYPVAPNNYVSTELAEFLSQLEVGIHIVIVKSWESKQLAQMEVEKIKGKYPELFFRQTGSKYYNEYYNKYGEGKYFDGTYWANYIGGFYTYEDANLLREKAVKELGMKDAFVTSPITEKSSINTIVGWVFIGAYNKNRKKISGNISGYPITGRKYTFTGSYNLRNYPPKTSSTYQKDLKRIKKIGRIEKGDSIFIKEIKELKIDQNTIKVWAKIEKRQR
jgi:hypothetical protein